MSKKHKREDRTQAQLEDLKKKMALIRANSQGLTESDTLFLCSLLDINYEEKDPTIHHIFLDEPAGIMSELSGRIYTRDDTKEIIKDLRKRYRYCATNDEDHFGGFRVTDYFVGWLKNIGAM